MNKNLERIPEIKRLIEIISGFPTIAKQAKETHKINRGILLKNKIFLSDKEVAEILNYLYGESTTNLSMLVKTWKDYSKIYTNYIDIYRELGNNQEANPKYYKWKKIQINRCNSELGEKAKSLIHGLFTFELSEGCSIGCKFCGLNSSPFKRYFEYNSENKELWSQILLFLKQKFGASVKTGVCYWATEPSDNPDYFKFLNDYKKIVGAEPQTTSAIIPQRISFIKDMIDFHKNGDTFSRVSVLSESILQKILKTYTPQELKNIILLNNYNDLFKKVNTGRNITKEQDNIDGTIACITGFLINMCEKTIKLVSPCKATKQWPNGYKIYSSFNFTDIKSFKNAINVCCEKEMQTHISSDDKPKFRNDLAYKIGYKELTITTPHMEHVLSYDKISDRTIKMMNSGTLSFQDICNNLSIDGANYIEAVTFLQTLYNTGLIELNN